MSESETLFEVLLEVKKLDFGFFLRWLFGRVLVGLELCDVLELQETIVDSMFVFGVFG